MKKEENMKKEAKMGFRAAPGGFREGKNKKVKKTPKKNMNK